ncbi:hypothetical protein QYM36_003763 [Artemia franciscana]|uniref:Uncharacterized protein n=2 Tax=Artemia franciscana TaxID=6661 RepID=A0AA88I4V2_ARTSF|nr:hypothetical protein QYM36_003763 [Artemia franciscana]
MPSSSARCAQLPRAMDKVPFYSALKKFRDYLNGLVPSIDDSEIVFPEARFPVGDESVDFSDLKDDSDLISYSGDEPLGMGKKKRGRPKKVKSEDGFPFKSEGSSDGQILGMPPPGGQPLDFSIMGDGTPRKKRGRPKKIKAEETGMISATPTRRPSMPHETHVIHPNDNYIHYYSQHEDLRPIGHFALPPPMRSPNAPSFPPHFPPNAGFPPFPQTQGYGEPASHSPLQGAYPFSNMGHQSPHENHYPSPQVFSQQNNQSPYPQNYAQQPSFSPSCGTQPVNFSQSPARVGSNHYHHSPQAYSHTPSPAVTPQSSSSSQFPNFNTNDLPTDLGPNASGSSLTTSPPPKNSPGKEFESQETPQAESPVAVQQPSEIKTEEESKQDFYSQESAFHDFGYKTTHQESFPPKPTPSSQDLAAKSLHGLESLVDQIPNLGEQDANHQYPPNTLHQYEAQYGGYNYGDKNPFHCQSNYPGYNYPRYPSDQQFSYPQYMGRSPYQASEPGYGSYGGQYGVPPAPYGSPAAGSLPFPQDFSGSYPYQYSNSPYQQSVSPPVMDKPKQESLNFAGF